MAVSCVCRSRADSDVGLDANRSFGLSGQELARSVADSGRVQWALEFGARVFLALAAEFASENEPWSGHEPALGAGILPTSLRGLPIGLGVCLRMPCRIRLLAWMVGLLLFVFAAEAKAVIDRGVVVGAISSASDGEVTVKAPIYFAIKWRFTILAGEPVLSCYAAWQAPPRGTKVTFEGETYTPPSSVLRSLHPYNVQFVGEVAPFRSYRQDAVYFACDLGVLAQPTPIPRARLLAWAKRVPKKSLSYNVAGSPYWAQLFRQGNKWLTKLEAVAIAKKRLEVRALPNVAQSNWSGISKAEWDMSAFRAWLAKKEKAKSDNARATLLKARRAKAKARQEAAGKLKGAAFWDSPADPTTQDGRLADAATDERVEALAASTARFQRLAGESARHYAQWASRRREDLKNPGARAQRLIIDFLNGPKSARTTETDGELMLATRTTVRFSANPQGRCAINITELETSQFIGRGTPSQTTKRQQASFYPNSTASWFSVLRSPQINNPVRDLLAACRTSSP